MTDTVPASAPPQAEPSWLSASAFLFATYALGQAVQVSNGNLHPASIRWLAVTVVLALVGVFAAKKPVKLFTVWGEGVAFVVALAAIGLQLGDLLTRLPGIYMRLAGPQALVPFYIGLALATAVGASGLAKKPVLGRWTVVVLALVFLFLGRWMLQASPSPIIDVFVFQRDGAAALLHGQNPYALRYPDIYGNSPFYGEGLSVGGVLQFGYPYPPLSLLMVVPAHALAGDYRWAQLLAMAVSAVFIAWTKPGRWGNAAAALFLFTPRSLFVLEQGWTEPLVVLLLTGTVFTATRFPKAAPWVTGLFLVVKQYLVFLVPLAWFLLPVEARTKTGWRRWAAKAVGLGAAVSLPLALWNVKEFWHDVVALQTYQPFRVEALSFLAWYNQSFGSKPPVGLAFLAAIAMVALAFWKLPRTPAGFAAASAVVLLCFFAFNKQAFCNYYYLVIGALALAAATAGQEEPWAPWDWKARAKAAVASPGPSADGDAGHSSTPA